MADQAHRQELAAFLRARRNRLKPADVGIPSGGRRRTPGLRREEVSQLTGVSVTWYTWLEQARNITVSRQVLDSLATGLKLDDVERQHLFALAATPLPLSQQTTSPSASLRRLLEVLNPHPAYLVSPSWDLLAWNDAEVGLIGDPERLPAPERNIIRMMFADTSLRRLLVNWRVQAASLLGQFRVDAGKYVGDPRFDQLSNELCATSEVFRGMWDSHDVGGFGSTRWEFDHPRLGLLTVDYVRMAALDSPEIRLFTCMPADESTAAKLPALLEEEAAEMYVG
ncbi:helix-turn-helix transcriptional regulator [Amycolatopsis sp. NPDC098790]|uniref:helix-turn-helix transcriptional regulator n=1 Tax=Amycolatopsis sp. NPDC098790 TaxID=3363939 RepID=UPI00381A3A10